MSNTIGRRLSACSIFASLALALEAGAAPELPAGPAAPAVPVATFSKSFWRATEEAATLAGGLPVRLNKTLLRDGELRVVTVDVPHEGYLNVVSVGPDDVATVLFPNQQQPESRVPMGKFTIPGEMPKFELKAAPPYGRTLIAAFLSKDELNFYSSGIGERDEQGAMQQPFARLSGESRVQFGKLAAKSFIAAATPPLLAGLTYGLVCAPTGPCDLASAPTSDVGAEEGLAPGVLLESELELALPKGVRLRALTDKGLRLAKLSEGFVPRLYDNSARQCSIAYGHLVKKSPCDGSEPIVFRRGVSDVQGEMLLVEDLRRAQRAVMGLVKTDLTDQQFAALANFTFNVGAGMLQKSTLLEAVNAGQHERVPAQLRRWTLVDGKESRRLKVRREREIALYFEGGRLPKASLDGENLAPIDIRVGEPPRPLASPAGKPGAPDGPPSVSAD